jgi:transposase
MAAGGRGGSMRRARRSYGHWSPSTTTARWTSTESNWRNVPADPGSAGRPCAARCGGSGWGAKKTLRASEQDRADIQAERAVFCEKIRQLDPKELVFIDETGITTAMTRPYARAPRGERARGSAPGGWRRLSVLGALSGEGMIAAMSIPAATTTRVFVAFLQEVLIPELRRRHPGATVLMDNLSAHKPKQVESALTGAGFKLLYLPRYSPDLSPIEPGWSKLKNALRTTKARTRDALETALLPALDSITPADARGWFNHCGYSFLH